ncbi:uncharacterized protein PV06_04559 [Exophiala oligosperma]|uniref:Uncharacterized protein n=1 Tax=Exophiala oligosperma TaxID=215243 RepID=A0A0D2DKI9_9EURO|nr:uncharacterized protein PV06_04559 [Exophiala oligosperma]KIW43458.1 hypothetical protein PV06_04559 [Exophiala oligosperma]
MACTRQALPTEVSSRATQYQWVPVVTAEEVMPVPTTGMATPTARAAEAAVAALIGEILVNQQECPARVIEAHTHPPHPRIRTITTEEDSNAISSANS